MGEESKYGWEESGVVVSLGSVALVPALKSMEVKFVYRSFIPFPVLAFV